MDFNHFLGILKSEKEFKPLHYSGGQTQGRMKVEKVPEKTKPVKQIVGQSYATKCQMQDYDEDEIGCGPHDPLPGAMSTVEDSSTICPEYVANPNEVDGNLTDVYDQYDFDKKRDNRLKINKFKETIIDHVDQNLITVIKGQTGCGKTTQVPQFILDSSRNANVYCNIVVTQPRRIAAVSVAKRVCEERGWNLGTITGYQIGLEKEASKDTRLLYCTAGVLLQSLVKTQNLSLYTHIIIDEVHERDNETDFLLIVIKRLLRINNNRTKLILMSATIKAQKFAEYFSNTVREEWVEPPIVELDQNTLYPVTCHYLDVLIDRFPIRIPEISMGQPHIAHEMYELAALLIGIFPTIDNHEMADKPFLGSVLVFLPGLHEIEKFYETLQKISDSKDMGEKWMMCPLHSSVTYEEQMKAFRLPPKGTRKIIIATNIAESSITVPDVKYVIDFCLMKVQVQKQETSYSALELCWISKSQGSQRAGRVGRVMSGRVYRMVPQEIYEDFDDECKPEMLRCSLDSLVLKSKQLRMGSPKFILGNAMDPPDLENIERTVLNLKEARALHIYTNGVYKTDDGDLTPTGEVMASLPLDPQLSKIIILGHMFGCLEDSVIMACCMAVKSVFSTPFQQQLEAYDSKITWADSSSSDPIATLNVYKLWRHMVTIGKFKRSGALSEYEWAKKYFVQTQSLKEVARLESEILQRLARMNIEKTQNVDWGNDKAKPLMLKLLLAAAAYPNYYSRIPVDEKESVKTIGGRDPFSTVYLSNFPQNQPGPLYVQKIKSYFRHCGSGINVNFDGSSKVYLRFESSETSHGENTSISINRNISMAVYRAIKLRQLRVPIVVPLLKPDEATRRAQKLFGDNFETNVFCWQTKKPAKSQDSLFPDLIMTPVKIVITHIENPNCFYVHINDEQYGKKQYWVSTNLNVPGASVKIKRENIVEGKLCIAPYTEDHKTEMYRVKIICVHEAETPLTAQVFYIDFGNKENVPVQHLYDYTETSRAVGLMDAPGLAIRCSLAEIEPSLEKNPKGVWSKEAILSFTDYINAKKALVKIYSVVNETMIVHLFKEKKSSERQRTDLENRFSCNKFLVEEGFASFCEEPYLSRENNLLRQTMANQSSTMPRQMSDLESKPVLPLGIESPSELECHSSVKLKGPFSPLEIQLRSLARKSKGMVIQVEWNSVNSVLLDPSPMDPHDRLLVASTVTQSHSTDRLTLRNTTLMPNIHGLNALLSMIFSPFTELRTDSNRKRFIGALCGLGFNPKTRENYNPENEIEITFDTKFDLADLELINKLRFWMSYIMGSGEKSSLEDLSKVRCKDAQEKIRGYIIQILGKQRASQTPETFDQSHRWDLVPKVHKLCPLENESLSTYPLIWGIALNKEGESPARVQRIQNNLDKLEELCEGVDMRGSVKCELCDTYISSKQNLKLHLVTAVHKNNLNDFCSKF